jgi:hypothetical protein
MVSRLIPAVFLITGISLLFCHPSPFREPEYLQKRKRLLKPEVVNVHSVFGDFDRDGVKDSAYIVVPAAGPDSGKVFVRFNHLIPGIETGGDFDRVSHLEKVDDINGDGASEIYFVASQKGSCNASGFLYRLSDRQWKMIRKLDQEGCRAFYGQQYVSVPAYNKYQVRYRPKNGHEDKIYEGVIQ